ncbi:hypothetical protein HYC85_020491 [Camellia sinensis]|uniref:Uncharacterized protein n=1 Tax=Camellia sinensis TaxID=4442 RepID=A0A7J7GPX3_CAMSI|nr:hypothetical protein HYC85_020491 [Camellia sinensis]
MLFSYQMAKGKKQWIKPGFLAKQELIEYKKERNKRIKKNNKKMNALQVNSLMGSTQPNCVNEKGKNIRVEVDDNDYIPSDHHDTDDESFESVEDEVLYARYRLCMISNFCYYVL